MMLQPSDAHLTSDLARGVCERTGSAEYLEGSIAALGTSYVLSLRAKDCRTGELAFADQAQVGRKEDALKAISDLARNFRNKAGESVATIRRHDTPLDEATTSSLEALKAYSLGSRQMANGGPPMSLPLFKRATELDPSFAIAWAWLGRSYTDVADETLAVDATRKAWQLRDRASDQERFFLDFSYYKIVEGDLEKARQTCLLWAETYPRAWAPEGFLGSSTSGVFGKFDECERHGTRALQLQPANAMAMANLASSFMYRNRFSEGKAVIHRSLQQGLVIPETLWAWYQLAFVSNDRQEMERATARSQSVPGSDDWLAFLNSCERAYYGHLREARTLADRAIGLARQRGQMERSSGFASGVAVREVLYGNPNEAIKAANSINRAALNPALGCTVGFVRAITGNTARLVPSSTICKADFPITPPFSLTTCQCCVRRLR